MEVGPSLTLLLGLDKVGKEDKVDTAAVVSQVIPLLLQILTMLRLETKETIDSFKIHQNLAMALRQTPILLHQALMALQEAGIKVDIVVGTMVETMVDTVVEAAADIVVETATVGMVGETTMADTEAEM